MSKCGYLKKTFRKSYFLFKNRSCPPTHCVNIANQLKRKDLGALTPEPNSVMTSHITPSGYLKSSPCPARSWNDFERKFVPRNLDKLVFLAGLGTYPTKMSWGSHNPQDVEASLFCEISSGLSHEEIMTNKEGGFTSDVHTYFACVLKLLAS